MKQEVFNQYAEKVSEVFRIDKESLFSKSKKRETVDARYLLYYLCFHRPMQVGYIERFMSENGYSIQHSTIIHGINVVKSKVNEDKDYEAIVKDLEKSVYI
jgi:chromosomal replication initiation ATPase DnaA